MKNIILIIIAIFLLSGCIRKGIDSPIIEDNTKNNDEPIVEEEKYVDDNPVKIGFYDNSGKLINSYDGKWSYHNDIAWINIFPTNEETASKVNNKTTWHQYWKDYVGGNYKFGLEISYSLNNGEDVYFTILKPSDNKYFDYVELYVYDGYNATTGWFDHLDDNEITNDTVYTSVKITSGIHIDEVISPIVLKVFTYDGYDDFDELGRYRGNSYNTVTINKLQ